MSIIGHMLKPANRKRVMVIAATAAAILLFALVSGHNYFRARDQQIQTMRGYADRTLVAIDDHITRSIEASDSYLRTVRAYYIEHGLGDGPKTYEFRQFIERTRPRDSQMSLGDISVIDATGHAIFMLALPEPSEADLSEQPYFKALRSDPRDRLIIDPTRLGRAVPEFRYRLIRPIVIDGTFRGAMLMALRPEPIIDLFSEFGLGPHSTIAVAQTDERRFIARVPVANRDYFDRPFGDQDVWSMIMASSHGVFHREAQIDHLSRYFTFLKSDGLPIVSIIGVADIDISADLAGTRRDLTIQMLVFALAAVAIGGLVLQVIAIEDRLRRSRASLEHGQRIGRIGSVEVDIATQKATWSDELFAIYRRDPDLGPADLESFLAYLHPDDKDKADAMRDWQKRGIDGGPIEYRIRWPNGEVRWIHREVEIQRDPSGKPLTMIATEQDITERRRMEVELQREHARLVFAQRMARMGSAELNLKTGVAVRSDEFFRVVGAEPGKPPSDRDEMAIVFHPDDRDLAADAVKRMMNGEPVPTLELRVIGADGETRWVRRDQEFILGDDGGPERAMVTLLDITDQKRLQLQKDEFAATLIGMANHDELTGLPALRLARDRLQVACHQALRDNSRVAVLFIDLDGFKEANDRFGHAAGDQVLRVVASRLIETIRGGDTASRHGGDEFAVILNGVTAEAAMQVAAKLVETIGRPISYGNEVISVGASIGIAIYPDHAAKPEDLFGLADQAMYAVKRAGKNGYRLYSEAQATPSPA